MLGPSFENGAIHASAGESVEDSFAVTRGVVSIQNPIRLSVTGGSVLVDVVSTDDPPLTLVSKKFISALQGKGFTGWCTFPVEIRDRNGEVIPDYEGIVVNGRCGSIENERSHRITRIPKSPKGTAREILVGVFFDEASWDGSDIFMPENYSYTIVTDSVRKALSRANISNVWFDRLTEVQRSTIELK